MSATKIAKAVRQLNAVVITSGLMQKTVKVRIGLQAWNSHIQKVEYLSYIDVRTLVIYAIASVFSLKGVGD